MIWQWIWALVMVGAWGADSTDASSDKTDERVAEETEDTEEKWDVNHPPGESRVVAIDTRQGTWMSVDVSPDGSTLVFDLLGDLYTLPIDGGEATSLTSGMVWDMQPRFSPDGQSIAYTSDAGGGDNIWVMNTDGSDARAVTAEGFRLLNSPAWAPDGLHIVARKHFTSARSLGAGEMWLYHLDGGSGLQLTKKPTDQKDVGEPAFSPDGRYLYYSLDATPGATFQYGKDPNKQIYAIERMDRVTGEVSRVTGGPGGAIRPTPSPDGTQLAFLRRVRAKTVLMIRDLASGAERPVFDGLDRDMQETWAIHGVYPQFCWMPDGQSVVIWFGGGLHRVQIADGAVRPIPFHVKDSREIRDALRFPVEVAPPTVNLKMLRDVAVSPGGDQVVYEALGKLWIRDLPEGTPRRLTKEEGQQELNPAWSRDGKSIVFATWSDEEFGSIRVIAARGGRTRVITVDPGHYVEPVFSPSGASIVYRKTGGGWLRTPLWSEDRGVYQVSRKGGEAKRVSRTGMGHHFGAEEGRLFYMSYGDDQLELRSVDLIERTERVHARAKMGTSLKISPDGRWLALQEQYNAYLIDFPMSGRPVDVSRKGEATPIARASWDTGDYLQFSGDSTRLFWATGPTLYSVSLERAFAEEEGERSYAPEETEGISIGFEQERGVHEGTAALVGARVVTMKGDEVIEDGTVVWTGERIVAVGPRSGVEVPDGAHVMDGAGLTVIPGLVDVHYHGGHGSDGILAENNWQGLSALSYGVTTTHDPSNATDEVFAASERQRAGVLLAPRIFSTGTILYGATSAGYTAQVDSLDDALSHLRRLKAVGAFSVKSYNQPRRDQRQQVVEAARQLEMMVLPEGGSLMMHNLNQVVDGHTGIEHAVPVAPLYDDVQQLWSQTKVGYTPTLGVAYGGLPGEKYWYGHTDVWDQERLLAFVPRRVIDPASRRVEVLPEEEYHHITVSRSVNALHDKGVNVQLGAHGQREGLAAHWELWMFGQGGMSPLNVLKVGTLEGAQYLGMEQDIGSIEVGKLADLAVLGTNPLENLRGTVDVRWTVLGGQVYDASTMNQVFPAQVERAPLYFELEGHGEPTQQHQVHCGCGVSAP